MELTTNMVLTKENYNKWRRKHRLSLKKEIKADKVSCQFCGYDKVPEILEYHHLNGVKKETKLCSLIRSGRSLEKIKKVLGKECIIVCPNCHSAIHYLKGSPVAPG